MHLKVYVASSWRNLHQPYVVEMLKWMNFEVYDFRHPSDGDDGFHWGEIDPNWTKWTTREYIDRLKDNHAVEGFKRDFGAMEKSDACILVLPSGRSAHIEAGYFAKREHKFLAIYIPSTEKIEPELMYSMADVVSDSLMEIRNKIVEWEKGGKV